MCSETKDLHRGKGCRQVMMEYCSAMDFEK